MNILLLLISSRVGLGLTWAVTLLDTIVLPPVFVATGLPVVFC